MTCFAVDGGAWKVDGRAQALVGLGLATPLIVMQDKTFKVVQKSTESMKIFSLKVFRLCSSLKVNLTC